jgi:hypothetical protein
VELDVEEVNINKMSVEETKRKVRNVLIGRYRQMACWGEI